MTINTQNEAPKSRRSFLICLQQSMLLRHHQHDSLVAALMISKTGFASQIVDVEPRPMWCPVPPSTVKRDALHKISGGTATHKHLEGFDKPWKRQCRKFGSGPKRIQ